MLVKRNKDNRKLKYKKYKIQILFVRFSCGAFEFCSSTWGFLSCLHFMPGEHKIVSRL